MNNFEYYLLKILIIALLWGSKGISAGDMQDRVRKIDNRIDIIRNV